MLLINGERVRLIGVDTSETKHPNTCSTEEHLMSQGVQQEALPRLLVEKGIFAKEELLEKVGIVNQEMKRKGGIK